MVSLLYNPKIEFTTYDFARNRKIIRCKLLDFQTRKLSSHSSHMLIFGLIGHRLPENVLDYVENLLFSSESVPHDRSCKQYICQEIKAVFV